MYHPTHIPTHIQEQAEATRHAEHLQAITATTTPAPVSETDITVRALHTEDAERLQRLAGLDSSPVPTGQVLGAEVDGTLVAVISLGNGGVIADPFRATSNAIELLSLRAQQLAAAKAKGPSRLRRVLDALGRGNAHAGLAGSPPGAGGRLLQL